MALTEKEIEFLEEFIPEQAQMALTQAYFQALESGSSVLICEDGYLLEQFPDGTRKELKKIPKPTPVRPGQKWEI